MRSVRINVLQYIYACEVKDMESVHVAYIIQYSNLNVTNTEMRNNIHRVQIGFIVLLLKLYA